ncbi:LacI family DNA-binding transcriptional regulator [Prauserella cavernicola]|uniref:LacI family DNA-binding transcriptional regulator n=1 Tax=Prauserella cavernicola TaxID=2800127 RepID=A0A934QS51_9PSEU|nr:LacI family DNA-binding transcriptional regulator [Prauserella cavernicola]MBK1787237.1 LacI family DNA-binding transcriptional regulator [Prauserella cavernicola]
MVTSRDVAHAAHVSQATVSRVLNGNTRVAPEARERVLRALDELGYVPNASAKAMRTARAGAVGIVASEMLNPYFPRLLDALTREARERDLTVLLWNDDDPAAPMAQAGVKSGAVDAVIFAAAKQETTGVDQLASRGVPVMLVNRADPGNPVDQVTSDHEGSGYAAAAYFLDRGRDDLATVFGPRDTFASPARERGFRRCLAERGVEVATRRWFVGTTSYEHGWASATALLESGTLPSAVFCSADLIAFGVISALRRGGVRVPEDVWVMGNDGLPMSEWDPFDLTTHRQPIEEIAKQGMDRLVARMAGEHGEPRRIMIPTELIVRGSTAHA